MFSNVNKIFSFTLVFILFICVLFIPVIYANQFSLNLNSNNQVPAYINQDKFVWPIPGYTTISSYFGKRNSPTARRIYISFWSRYPCSRPGPIFTLLMMDMFHLHHGVLVDGYTIVIKLSNYPDMSVSYCHVSPTMFVERGEEVSKNEILGMVGPKNVYGIINNPYKDSNGKPTNGATTGSHLHFTIKSNGIAVDPLSFY